MTVQIVDGTGTGRRVKVDSVNRLHSIAITVPTVGDIARREGNSFIVSLGPLTVTSTGGRIVYLRNTSSTHNIISSATTIGWNGGNTNHNRCLIGELYALDAPPTGNYLTGVPINTNGASGRQAEMLVYVWDGVGNGMTGGGGGVLVQPYIFSQGSTVVDEYSTIIPPNFAVGLNGRGEENGLATLVWEVFFYPIDDE